MKQTARISRALRGMRAVVFSGARKRAMSRVIARPTDDNDPWLKSASSVGHGNLPLSTTSPKPKTPPRMGEEQGRSPRSRRRPLARKRCLKRRSLAMTVHSQLPLHPSAGARHCLAPTTTCVFRSPNNLAKVGRTFARRPTPPRRGHSPSLPSSAATILTGATPVRAFSRIAFSISPATSGF